MKILTEDEVKTNKEVILEVIRNGTIFIHPTGPIYGLGCNAESEDCVDDVRDIKERADSPFSVIAPSKEWILENCIVNGEGKEWIDKLPGPYTLILRSKKGVAKNVAPGHDTLGIRMPDHWFSEIVRELGIPVVTTSANKSGENFMTSLDNLDDDIKESIEFIIYEGEKHGHPSTIVDLTGEKAIVRKR